MIENINKFLLELVSLEIKYWWIRASFHQKGEDLAFWFSNIFDESKVQKLMVHKTFPQWASEEWLSERLKKVIHIHVCSWAEYDYRGGAKYDLPNGPDLESDIAKNLEPLKAEISRIFHESENFKDFYNDLQQYWLSKYPKEFDDEVCRGLTLGEALLTIEKHIQDFPYDGRPKLSNSDIAGLFGITVRQVNNKLRAILQRDSEKYWEYNIVIQSPLKFMLLPNL